jgi:preprotein translocase subunit YajC
MTMSLHTSLSLGLDGQIVLGTVLGDTSTTQDPGGSFLFTLMFMGVIGGAMYFLMIRPQRRRLRQTQELQRAIEVGDEIITNSGTYGFVNAIDGDVVWLEIAENTEIRIARNSMLRRINPVVEPAGGEPGMADEQEGE